ncbi:MAG: translesion error-prone DNA polymerase V autoproteolytic subunit [Bacteroidales bacterium]|nr:translesion error-prone DNA polymerase V autoproteolytic subunit [Bacteroidales bacterium]
MKKKNRKCSGVHEGYTPVDNTEKNSYPLYLSSIPAGFPSPAEDFLEKRLDLNDYLIKNHPATFLIRVSGESMINAGIFDGDLLVVDRSAEAANGKIILGVLNGEFTIKRLQKKGGQITLKPENPAFNPVLITSDMDFRVWGVVTFAIHKL